jgi:hypothetical protein
MTQKTVVFFLTLFFCVYGAFPVQAQNSKSNVWINPAYKSSIFQDEIPLPDYSRRSSRQFTCTSEAAVADYLRENFQARNTQISFVMDWDFSWSEVEAIFLRAREQATQGDDYLEYCIMGEGRNFSGWDGSAEANLSVLYVATYDEEQQVDQRVSEILPTIVDSGMGVEAKGKAIHDWIVANVEYDRTLAEHSAYAALFRGTTVCQGYALLLHKMLEEVGISSRIVRSEEMSHAWNMVNLCGTWYHVDATWDDPLPDVPGRVLYNYFNLSDVEIGSTHVGWKTSVLDAPDAPISYVEGVCDESFTVATNAITAVTHSSAASGGNIVSANGTNIMARGVCWSVNQNPTISDAKTFDGIGTGMFRSSIEGLLPNTTYFVRAYATNSSGTAYGNQISFATPAEPTRIINLNGSLAFDNVLVGSTRQRTFTIANSGNSVLTVGAIAYPPGFAGNWNGGTIPPSGSRTVTVTFSPVAAQSYGGTATVQSDKTGGTNTLPVSGTGTAVTRVIELSGSLAFGEVDVNTTEQRTFAIANRGNSALTVEFIAYPSGFAGNWSGGTIASGSSRTVTVTFVPTAAQGYGGTATVVSDRTSGANTLAVSGTGVSRPVSHTISGHVRDARNAGIGGVTLTFGNGGGTAVTDGSGFYSKAVDSGWTGMVAPSGTGYSFVPSSRSYAGTSRNWTDQNYAGGVPPTAFRIWIDKNGNGAYDPGEGVSGASVRVNHETEDRGTTDGQGIIQIPGVENSDRIYAQKLLYAMNHPKALDDNFDSRNRNPYFVGTVNGKMYDFVMASDIMAADGNYFDFPGQGNTLLDAAKDAQGNILVQLVHPKIGWNLVVAFEEAQSPAFYGKVISGFRSYADYMYNFTDGYFVVRNVVLVKGAYLDSAQWNYSDVQIRNVEWPNAHIFGSRHNLPNLRISMGKEWEWAEPDGYNWYSTLGHEAGHYLYGFGDEYMNGDYIKGLKIPWTYREARDGDPGEPDEFPKNYGVMDRQYISHELSDITDYFVRSYSPSMNPDLVTAQFMTRQGQSCWAFLKSYHENDIRQQTAANGLTGFSEAFFDNLIIPPNLAGSYPGSDRTKRNGPARMNRDSVRFIEWNVPGTTRAGLRGEEVFDATALVLDAAGNPVADADVWLVSPDRKSFQGKSNGNGIVKCGGLLTGRRLEAFYEGRRAEVGIGEVRDRYVLTLPARRARRTGESTGMVLTAKPASHDSGMLTITASGSFLPTEPATTVSQSGGYSVNVAMNADGANRYSGTAHCRHDSGIIETTSGENISISPFEIFSTEFGPASGYYAPNGELEMKYGPSSFEGSGSFAIVNSSGPAPPNLGMIQVGNVYAFGFSDSITAVKNVVLTIRLPENRKGMNPELYGWDAQNQTWMLIEGGVSDFQYFSIQIASMDYNAYAMFMTPRANDPYPPEPATEFAASTGTSMWNVDLQWTTPDDTDVAAYKIRFANAPITDENWDGSIPLGNIPAPAAPRTVQRFTADMPDPDTLYYFGIRAIDGAGNVSSLATSSPAVSHAPDSNGDGIPDVWKISHGLDPNIDCSQRDGDGDGLTNLDEYLQRTEPKNSDTDRDGFSDGDEIARGTDPVNPLSYPASFNPPPGTLQDVIAGLRILTGQITNQDISNADADRNGILEMKDVLINLQSVASIR